MTKKKIVKNTLIENLELTLENTRVYPWEWADNSVDNVSIIRLLEFIPGKERGKFMDELHRILAPEGTAMIKVPYWSSAGGVQDYLYEWPPWNDNSFMYFNKEIRKNLGCDDRGLVCDFDFTGGYELEAGIAQRSEDARNFAAKHYTNSILAVQLTLTKKKLK